MRGKPLIHQDRQTVSVCLLIHIQKQLYAGMLHTLLIHDITRLEPKQIYIVFLFIYGVCRLPLSIAVKISVQTGAAAADNNNRN